MREKVAFYADSVEHIRLEGILEIPEGEGPHPACILCHPHPLGGGSMHVPLLQVLSQVLCGQGWACLRFNFRGVGRSTGESSGGLREPEDIRGAHRYLREREEVDAEDLSLAGWSFGSWVGLRWAVEAGCCRRLALVSPPLVGFDFFHFLEGREASELPDVLLVAGSRDQFAEEGRLRELAGRLGGKLVILEGADHFLFGYESMVAQAIADHWKNNPGRV